MLSASDMMLWVWMGTGMEYTGIKSGWRDLARELFALAFRKSSVVVEVGRQIRLRVHWTAVKRKEAPIGRAKMRLFKPTLWPFKN